MRLVRLLIIIVSTMLITVFIGVGVVCYADSINTQSIVNSKEEIYFGEELLYDLHDNITYRLNYCSIGGYSITHIASGVVCEYDEERVNPFAGKKGRLYYAGPGNYLSINERNIENLLAINYFNVSLEEVKWLDEINADFMEQESLSTKSVTVGGYTMIAQHGYISNYYLDASLNNDNGCGKAASVLLLRFYDQYYNSNYIPAGVSDTSLYNYYINTQLWNNGPSLCSSIKQGLIDYLDIYASSINATITYNILSPRNKIIERIAQDQPSILVLTASDDMELVSRESGGVSAHCALVYGFSGDYYRIHSTWNREVYNVHRRYAYGAVFLTQD